MPDQEQLEIVAPVEKFAPSLREDETIELFPLSELKFSERQRKKAVEEMDISDLASSIETVGLLHPITIEDDGTLLAGFRRTMAAMSLGWERIPARRRSNLDSVQKKIIELDENLQRLDLDWFEKSQAIAQIHELYKELHPEWNMKKIGEMIGVADATISRSVALAEAAKEDPKLREHKSLVAALGAVKTKKQIEQRKNDIASRPTSGRGLFAKILPGDALSLFKRIEDESIDTVISNFPFGVDLELKGRPAVYDDAPDEIDELAQRVVAEIFRVLKNDSWAVIFFASQKLSYTKAQADFFELSISMAKRLRQKDLIDDAFLQETIDLGTRSLGLKYWLETAGFSYVTSNPAIWAKPNKTQGIVGDPRKGMIVAYEQFLFAAKGDPALHKQGRNNLFLYETPAPSERVHALQMNLDLCEELVALTTIGGSIVLDPFAGSGSIGVGALRRQANFIGFELNPDYAEAGQVLLDEELGREE